MISTTTMTLLGDPNPVLPAEVTWRTLARTDASFSSYLDGSFSDTHRALPVRSLHVGTNSEEVTFEIVPRSHIRSPSLVRTLWLLARPQSLILSAGPMFVTWLFVYCRQLTPGLRVSLSSFFGVLLFQVAINLFNDYGDHFKGRDRLRLRGGSRVIQNGWLAAHTVRRLAWLAMAVAFVFGLPALLAEPVNKDYPMALIAGFAGLVGLEFALQRFGLKYRGWAEVLAFALTGPLLTLAYAWAISGSMSWAEVMLGGIFGSMSLMYFHAVNFENIMADSQAGVRTWATRAGFDASKRFFYFCAILSASFAAVFAIFFAQGVLFTGAVIVHSIGLWFLSDRVASLASPLSSRLNGLRRLVLWSAWGCALLLAMAFFIDTLVSTI